MGSRPPRPGDVSQATQTLADGLCQTDYTLLRPRGGPFDRVNARRLAKCGAQGGGAPVVVYLPGMHMNGAIPDAVAPDFRRTLAAAGVRVWSVDYRTHFVPADAAPEALDDLTPWTPTVFSGDAEALIALSRTVDTGPLYVTGFSFGAGLAYRVAAHDVRMAGLVILDGVPPEPRDDGGGGDGPAIDVGSSRLPFDLRTKLLADVLADPGGPSPVPDYPTAGAALTDIVDTSRAFGGHGGLSGVKTGSTDVRALAALLSTYDRWWPRATLAAKPAVTPGRPVRVLAFAAANMGSAWVGRVRDGARAFGGDGATVIELPGYGHVDVLIGKDAPRLVFDPIRRFVQGEAIGVQPGRSK